MPKIEIKGFHDLSNSDLYDILALRAEVFVVEQNCPYQDLDGKDKVAQHVLLRNDLHEIVGTARILPEGVSYPNVSIGRVVISSGERDKKWGNILMQKSIDYIEHNWGVEKSIQISAQTHLTNFYENIGFKSTGKQYLEDGIPHTEMIRNK